MGAKGHATAGECLNLLEEGWIERAAVVGEGQQSGGVLRILDGEHASGCPGGLSYRFAGFEERDFPPAICEKQCKARPMMPPPAIAMCSGCRMLRL